LNYLRNLAVLALLTVGLAACTSGQSAIEPPFKGVNVPATATLQFAPGTARIATGIATSAVGFNVVATLRAPTGLTAALYNTPTITGPPGFVCNCTPPAGNIDNGTNHLSGTLPIQLGLVPPVSTFGSGTNVGAGPGASSSTGVTGYGLMPTNSNTSGSAFFTPFTLPFFPAGGTVGVKYIGGPPAFPNVRDGTYPAGYRGFTEGFADFEGSQGPPTVLAPIVPVAGIYTLGVQVPTGFDQSGNPTSSTISTTASITTPALPFFARPVFTPDGTGGGSIAYVLPAGVTEAYLQVRNNSTTCYPSGGGAAPAYFTIRVTPASANPAILPNNLGETSQTKPSTHTLCTSADNAPGTGDNYTVYAVGFDYPAFASAYPQSNGQAAPAIANAAGQADVTTSFPQVLTYP